MASELTDDQRTALANIRLRYVLFLGLYASLSLAAQFGCATPVDLSFLFSNFAAAFSGGALFYWVAFSDLLTRLAAELSIPYENPMVMEHLVKGWFCQSLVIWLSSVGMALLVGKWLDWQDRQFQSGVLLTVKSNDPETLN